MHKGLLYAAYGWLTLGGSMHFLIDVVSQYLRDKRPPGPETTLYWGLNSAYALGQIAFGVFALLLIRQAPEVLDRWPAVSLSLSAAGCWLAISILFMGYREPRYVVGIFAALVLGAALSR